MGGVVGSIVEAVVDIPGTIVDVSGKAIKAGGKFVDDALGLDSVGNAIADVGGDISQIGKVLKGDYHDDAKKVQELQDRVSAEVSKYNSNVDALADKMQSLVAFHEIFKIAASNRMDEYVGKYGPQLDAMISEYNAAAARLKSEYDFVIGLTEGMFLEKVIGSIIMIIGGIMSDMGDILNGTADANTWKRVITTAVMVLAVVAMFFVPGLQGAALAVAVSLAAINAFMTLDGMYANGAATGAIMGILDTVFNDILNLDDLIGKDFNKFDSDHKDYQEMVMYVQLAIAIGQLYVAMPNLSGSPASMSMNPTFEQQMGIAGKEISTTAGTNLGEQVGRAEMATTSTSYMGGLVEINRANMSNSTMAGVKFGTYSQIYKAYTTAQGVKDVVSANEQYDALKAKMEEDREKLETAITSKISKGFMKSYKDMAYFLQDQQEYIDRYVWGMAAQNMYVDPYGTTPVANIRFTPDKDTRMMTFGYEEVFDESKQAGSRGYFNNILYG